MPLRVTDRKGHLGVLARIALLVAAGDWLTKAAATRFVGSEPVVFSDRLRFAVVHNDGTAFGLSAGAFTWQLNLALTLAAIALMLPVARDLAKIDDRAPRALGLILGGAIGNFASLMLSPPGVVDFISVAVGAHSELVLNFADLAAYAGLAMMLRTGFLIVAEIRHTTRATLRTTQIQHWTSVRRRSAVEREVPLQAPIADLILPQNEITLPSHAPLSDLTVPQAEVIVTQTAPLADLLLPEQEIMIPRPESVRRVEMVDFAKKDPKVIDIRPHLAQSRVEARGQRAEGLRGD